MPITENYQETSSNSTSSAFDTAAFEEKVDYFCSQAVNEFKHICKYYLTFHSIFAGLALAEVLCFLVFFPFFSQSSVIVFTLAGFFLTAFTYFILYFYYQTKKPEQFIQLRDNYIKATQHLLPYKPGSVEYHLCIVHSLYRLNRHLKGIEKKLLLSPHSDESLIQVMQKFSTWCHWKEVHKMREVLFYMAINEHINLIKTEPTDLEAHASLAQTYLELSKLYQHPEKLNDYNANDWIPKEFSQPEMKERFQLAAERAIEELKIVKEYVPDDLWASAELASIYNQLERYDLEIAEYESILSINPKDADVQVRLGALYFQQGKTAKALKIYESLRKAGDKRAEELISHYGSFSIEDFSFI